MIYRVQVLVNSYWRSVGLDCISAEEVHATVNALARGAVHRVITVGC